MSHVMRSVNHLQHSSMLLDVRTTRHPRLELFPGFQLDLDSGVKMDYMRTHRGELNNYSYSYSYNFGSNPFRHADYQGAFGHPTPTRERERERERAQTTNHHHQSSRVSLEDYLNAQWTDVLNSSSVEDMNINMNINMNMNMNTNTHRTRTSTTQVNTTTSTALKTKHVHHRAHKRSHGRDHDQHTISTRNIPMMKRQHQQPQQHHHHHPHHPHHQHQRQQRQHQQQQQQQQHRSKLVAMSKPKFSVKRMEKKSGNCGCCGTNSTPLWREGRKGARLCNACGIRWVKYGIACDSCKYVPRKHEARNPNCPKCTTPFHPAEPLASRRRGSGSGSKATTTTAAAAAAKTTTTAKTNTTSSPTQATPKAKPQVQTQPQTQTLSQTPTQTQSLSQTLSQTQTPPIITCVL